MMNPCEDEPVQAVTERPPKAAAQARKCACCNHPVSFHRNGSSPCFVAGCSCSAWVEPERLDVPVAG